MKTLQMGKLVAVNTYTHSFTYACIVLFILSFIGMAISFVASHMTLASVFAVIVGLSAGKAIDNYFTNKSIVEYNDFVDWRGDSSNRFHTFIKKLENEKFIV